jgi:chromosome segregation ATPase
MWWPYLVQIINWLGIPAVIGWALYDRRRIRNENRIGGADANVAELTVPDRIKSSSIVTLEAELVAARKSFEADRAIKDETIRDLRQELTNARNEDDRKDQLIEDLLRKVRTQGRKLEELQRTQEQMEHELTLLKNGGPPRPLASAGGDVTGP